MADSVKLRNINPRGVALEIGRPVGIVVEHGHLVEIDPGVKLTVATDDRGNPVQVPLYRALLDQSDNWERHTPAKKEGK